MRYSSLIVALAAAASVTAYAQGSVSQGADDRTRESNAAESQSSKTGGSNPPTGTTPSTNEPATVATGVTDSSSRANTGDRHDTTGGSASTAMTMQNDPELKNLTTEKFIQRAAASGMKEVQAAEIALRNSKDDQVKSFAREMLAAHTKQNGQLTTLAAKTNLQVPKDLPTKDRQELERLRSQTGRAFDTAYIELMQMDHQKAVALFQSCANATQVSADIRQFCRTQLPTLQEHHRDARTLDPHEPSRSAASEE